LPDSVLLYLNKRNVEKSCPMQSGNKFTDVSEEYFVSKFRVEKSAKERANLSDSLFNPEE
jgi:hypothetical protein